MQLIFLWLGHMQSADLLLLMATGLRAEDHDSFYLQSHACVFQVHLAISKGLLVPFEEASCMQL